MPLSVDNEANESRTQFLGVKRSLATSQGAQEGHPALHRSKKQKRDKEPSNEEKQILAKPFGEKYGWHSVEYKYQLKSRKGRKYFASKRKREGLPPLPHFSDFAEKEGSQPNKMGTLSTKDPAGPLAWNQGTSGTIRTSLRGNVAPAPASNLGNNRLATGFVVSTATAAPYPDSLESGETHSSPIEISSDEEEGALLINVEGQSTPEVISLDSDSDDDDDSEDDSEDQDDEEMEDGEEDERVVVSTSVSSPVLGDPDAHMQLQGDLERHLSNDFQPLSIDGAINKKPKIRLASLSADELESQYKYCFYGLARHQIDMNRQVICIECLQEGHMPSTCPEKYCSSCIDGQKHSRLQCPKYRCCIKCRERGHDAATCQSKLKQATTCECCSSNHHIEQDCPLRFFTSVKPINTATIKLWISCCNCASKTHLVGDCPALHPDTAPRWSLRTLPVEQIDNLSLQTGISGLAKAAESRNMRPQGRDIRPGTWPHQQQSSRSLNQRKTFDDSSEDAQESFLRPPIQRQNQSQGQKGNINITLAKQSDRSGYPQSQFQDQRRSPDPRDRDRDRDRNHYDTYDGPSTNNRSRGAWYESDSFGQRRRSRSPDPYGGGGDSYRPTPYPHDQPAQRRSNPTGSNSLGERVSYPHSQGGRGQDRGPPGALDSYRPPERGPPRPVKSTYQGHGRGQSGAQRQGQGQRKQGAQFR